MELNCSIQVEGRVLIDSYGYIKHHVSLQRRGGKAKKSRRNRERGKKVNSADDDLCDMPPPALGQFLLDGILMDSHGEPVETNITKDGSYIKRLTDDEQKKNRDDLLARKDDLVFLSPMLMGYALKNKLWRELPLPKDDVFKTNINHSQFLRRRHRADEMERRSI